MSDHRISLSHLTRDGNFIVRDYSDMFIPYIRYFLKPLSISEDGMNVGSSDWKVIEVESDAESITCGCHNWKIHESDGPFFLLADKYFGIIENFEVLNHERKVIRLLFAYPWQRSEFDPGN